MERGENQKIVAEAVNPMCSLESWLTWKLVGPLWDSKFKLKVDKDGYKEVAQLL